MHWSELYLSILLLTNLVTYFLLIVENSAGMITLGDLYTMRDKFLCHEVNHAVFYISILISIYVVINLALLVKMML
jgi:hypothetical protein